MNKFLQNCDELPKAPATGLLPAATAHPSAYFPCSGVLQKNAPLVTAAVPWARHGSRFTKSLFKIWRNARQAQIFSLGKAI